jgi:hypothetical protein
MNVDRREVLKGVGLAGLAGLLPAGFLAACTSPGPPSASGPATGASVGPTTTPDRNRPYLVLTTHEAAVVEAATARLIPGPEDDPSEAGHPGAREAGVTRYVDTMLGALALDPTAVFAGGPFSDRGGSTTNDMARFLGLTPAQTAAWTSRLDALTDTYREGVVKLDALAGGDFAHAPADQQDSMLASDPDGFTAVLFTHAIEGTYAAPEYGGNRDLSGWHEINFPGDRQPTGYTDDEVTRTDGPDVYVRAGIGDKLLTLLASTTPT